MCIHAYVIASAAQGLLAGRLLFYMRHCERSEAIQQKSPVQQKQKHVDKELDCHGALRLAVTQ